MTQQPRPLADRIATALSDAGAFCGECGFEPGETGCPDCVRVRQLYTEALLAVVQPELDAAGAEIRRLRTELRVSNELLAEVTAACSATEREAASLRAERDQARQQIADEIRAYCPDHGTADTCRMDCHCAIADEIDRTARPAHPTT